MKYEFEVREKPVPFSHFHGWVAVDSSNAHEVPLPDGGTGEYLGSYPEIQAYLSQAHGVQATLTYVRSRDELEIVQGKSATWTFKTHGNEIVVHDIPRTIARITIGR